MNQAKYPSLYQVNTRVWLTEISGLLKRKATLDDIPDTSLDDFVQKGFDWIWFLSVWTTGDQGQKISRAHCGWRKEFEETLSDLKEEDIAGSGFAITDYHVHPALGGDEALHRLRERMQKRGLKLMLDFVPNHIGPDHAWVKDHPEYFVQGTQSDLERSPQNYFKSSRKHADLIFAYGRDPYFDGWPDTVQLDYSNTATIDVMQQELLRISGQCDGLRCDMAMLILPDVFEKTWGRKAHSFWPEAIHAVRNQHPDFCFLAEVYWDMEWTLQQQGFDYAYDKRLYDRLCEGHAKPVREHFLAGLDYQAKLARFLENHDEPRAAATFELKKHEAAAVITFLSPGLRFFHQGQFEGNAKRISPHLVRAPHEPSDIELQNFYTSLLAVLQMPLFRNGKWQLLECTPAWEGNSSWESFVAFAWEGEDRALALVVINYAPHDSQCYLKMPPVEKAFGQWQLHDVMNEVTYDRNGNELLTKGLYLGMKPWQHHVFEVKK
jgi:hypothetical protein